ncbi:ATP-dependent helicase [Rhodopirellula sp. MGV]|uniref:ATP-dependent helicase n=1 Tax=Rhodopirellula sp. MGV TaxID=2023130 RepID=UPI000B95D613|nr:UvrD-helicase domain-containing protein [Rhodopirellula sp. MGV]OYP28865.1 AAA family ATPase [Rhodopirellula sp. MGV]PNY37021.1 AAA family ATPase [Rhodopirellula baltica]
MDVPPASNSRLLERLTPEQQNAVVHIDGPMLILAGPGSGKTRVVTHRVAHLLESGIPEWQIAALTFTNKAADEMRARVDSLAPGKQVWMGTFHRFCAQLLRRYAPMVGLQENYSIYDTSDSKQAMKRAIEAAGVSTSHASPDQISNLISKAKNKLITPEVWQTQIVSPQEKVASQVYPVYQKQLLVANAVDFDDLLLHVATMLRMNPELRSDLDARFRYIMVDEYQDTNLAQYAIVRGLSVDHPNLSVTGDPDQSIYGWRGADLNNILDFEKDYPNVKTVRLEQNYRSTPNILRAADQLIRHNRRRKQKDLFTENDEGPAVTLKFCSDGFEEADSIADDIVNLVASETAKPSDFAIFCRMNSLTRSVEHALRGRGVPYQIINGVEFYQRKEIKDILAYLHLVNNPSHDVALMRVINTPTRGIGAKTVERLQAFGDRHSIPLLEAARRVDEVDSIAKRSQTMVKRFVDLYDKIAAKATASLEEVIRYVVQESAYDKYLEKSAPDGEDVSPLANVDELVTAAADFDRRHPDDGSLDAFLEQVALVSDTDAFDDSDERVTLMTLHASKGLEFPRVYIIGVEDDLLPHKRSKDDDSQFEEERRLLFVGITRAEYSLQLSCCKRRMIRGEFRPVIPSPFLNELPLEEMQRIDSVQRGAWLDDVDQSTPSDWDMPAIQIDQDGINQDADTSFDFGANDHAKEDIAQFEDVDLDSPPPEPEKASDPVPQIGTLKTAADLMTFNRPPITAFQEGTRVRHSDYGVGVITAVSGRGPKRMARVEFNEGEHSFRLAFAPLELAD